MKPRWLHLFFFSVLLLAVTVVLRLALHTWPGLAALVGGLVFRLLWFLYQSMQALVIALWELSAGIVESLQESRARSASEKEVPHAARLL